MNDNFKDYFCLKHIVKPFTLVTFGQYLRVQYNNTFRPLMGLNRHCNSLGMFTQAHVDTFNATVSHRIASFLERLGQSCNSLIRELFACLTTTLMYNRCWLEIATYLKPDCTNLFMNILFIYEFTYKFISKFGKLL